jgi:hypothetical protein
LPFFLTVDNYCLFSSVFTITDFFPHFWQFLPFFFNIDNYRLFPHLCKQLFPYSSAFTIKKCFSQVFFQAITIQSVVYWVPPNMSNNIIKIIRIAYTWTLPLLAGDSHFLQNYFKDFFHKLKKSTCFWCQTFLLCLLQILKSPSFWRQERSAITCVASWWPISCWDKFCDRRRSDQSSGDINSCKVRMKLPQ